MNLMFVTGLLICENFQFNTPIIRRGSVNGCEARS